MSDSNNPPQDALTFGVELQLDLAYEGIDKIWPEGVDKLPLHGEWLTKEEFKAKIDAARKPWKNVREAKKVVRAFSAAKKGNKETASQLIKDLKDTMSAQHGGESEKLTEMGFKPRRRRRALTSAQAILANEKRQKTREMRGIMGKRQRAAIKYTGEPYVHITPDGKSTIYPDGPPPPPPPPPNSHAEQTPIAPETAPTPPTTASHAPPPPDVPKDASGEPPRTGS